MSNALKAIAIFAAMIVLPILADNFISRRPDVQLVRGYGWFGDLAYWLGLAAAGGAIVWILYQIYGRPGYFKRRTGDLVFGKGAIKKFGDDIGQIQSWVRLAERELLKLLADNYDQTGRMNKARERAEWAAMANPEIFPTVFQILKDPDAKPKDEKLIAVAADSAKWRAEAPMVQPPLPEVFGKLAEQAFDMNKTDMSNRGTAMGKVSWTAILLRDVYQASYGRAKMKLEAELAAGGSPFVAPGLKELFGFGIKEETVDGKTVKSLIWGPPHDYIKLKLAMRQGKFPKELLLKEKDKIYSGWETIWKLTQQAPPPGWTEPDKGPALPLWKLWYEYEQECWEEGMTPK